MGIQFVGDDEGHTRTRPIPMSTSTVSVFFRTRVDELTPFAVECGYDYFTTPASFDCVKTRSPVARVRSFVGQQIKPAIS
jgi:hypothetical protein